MRFKGTPDMHVIDAKSGLLIGKFDSKGYLEIEDEKLTARMRANFMPAPVKQKKKSKEVRKK